MRKPYSLIGVDGNAYCLMGYTMDAMRHADFTQEEINQMIEEAESGDYYNLIRVCNSYVQKVNERLGLDKEDE